MWLVWTTWDKEMTLASNIMGYQKLTLQHYEYSKLQVGVMRITHENE